MKRYIKPECEIIEISVEGHLLGLSNGENALNDEVADQDEFGAVQWFAPRRERSGSLWDDDEE